MPKLAPAMQDLRDGCVQSVETLVNTCQVKSYRDGFEFVYYTARSRKLPCGFDNENFERAYNLFRYWRSIKSKYARYFNKTSQAKAR